MYNYSFRVPTTSQLGVIPQIITVSRLRGSNNKKFVKIENISYEGKYKVVVKILLASQYYYSLAHSSLTFIVQPKYR